MDGVKFILDSFIGRQVIKNYLIGVKQKLVSLLVIKHNFLRHLRFTFLVFLFTEIQELGEEQGRIPKPSQEVPAAQSTDGKEL